MILCPYCNRERELLVEMPVMRVRINTNPGDVAKYERTEFIGDGGICFECLKNSEAEDLYN